MFCGVTLKKYWGEYFIDIYDIWVNCWCFFLFNSIRYSNQQKRNTIRRTTNTAKDIAYVLTDKMTAIHRYNKGNWTHWNNDPIKKILDTAKIIKSKQKPKKHTLISSNIREHTTQMVPNVKCKNKSFRLCNRIIEGKSYSFKTPTTIKKYSLHTWQF